MVEFGYLGKRAIVHDPHLSIFVRPHKIRIVEQPAELWSWRNLASFRYAPEGSAP